MSDIFHEVEEDLRRDRLKALWDKYGIFVLGLAVAIVLGTAAFKGWQYWQDTQARESGDRFISALKQAEDGDPAGASEAFAALATDGFGQYPLLAGFQAATTKAETGDFEAAIAEFDKLANSAADPLIADIARIRAAMLLVDHGSRADVDSRIAAIAAGTSALRHSARETMALAAWKAGDLVAAEKTYTELLGDPAVPEAMSQRADLALAVIASQGGPNRPRPDDD